jgi:hypothetical protein
MVAINFVTGGGGYMSTLCVIPCGKAKIWDRRANAGPTKAREVYTGPFARKCRQFAEAKCPASWCILSAKHGFLFPDDVVPGSYNVTFNDARTHPITVAQLCDQARKKRLDAYDTVVTLGGRRYVQMLKEVFPSKEILQPLAGCRGIGFMMAMINQLLCESVAPLDAGRR